MKLSDLKFTDEDNRTDFLFELKQQPFCKKLISYTANESEFREDIKTNYHWDKTKIHIAIDFPSSETNNKFAEEIKNLCDKYNIEIVHTKNATRSDLTNFTIVEDISVQSMLAAVGIKFYLNCLQKYLHPDSVSEINKKYGFWIT